MSIGRGVVRWLLTLLFRIKLSGFDHYAAAGSNVIIIANHASFLDGVLLTAFFPDRLTFAVNTHIASKWWVRFFLQWVDFVALDSQRPYALRRLLVRLGSHRKVVMFPEGRITLTGGLMKTYPGAAWLAERSAAAILPVGIEGPQYTPLSRLHDHMRLRWFPAIYLSLLPARHMPVEAGVGARVRRRQGARFLADTLADMVFASANYRCSLFEALLATRVLFGGRDVIAEDTGREPVTYNQLLYQALRLGMRLAMHGRRGQVVAMFMPNSLDGLRLFLGLQVAGRVPVMLDATTAGEWPEVCRLGGVETVYTSQAFRETSPHREAIDRLGRQCVLRFLEDIDRQPGIGLLRRMVMRVSPLRRVYRQLYGEVDADAAAVIFAEHINGQLRIRAYSHANLLANCHQLITRVDFNMRDVLLSVMPLSHVYGLNIGALLPLLAGMKVFFYPFTRPRRTIPEAVYEHSASILFVTPALLVECLRSAHPYDFHRTRYVFVMGKGVDPAIRRAWQERFGIRLLEGYALHESGPVLAVNTPIEQRPDTVGRLLPGIEWRMETGDTLSVRGPNMAAARLNATHEAPDTAGWLLTGDRVRMDQEGFVTVVSAS